MSTPQGPNPKEIQTLFASISKGYDKTNDLMTFGLARLWRKNLVEWSRALHGDHVLDVATGTGDLAIEFKKQVGAQGHVVGSDFCQEMLDQAPAKAKSQHLNVDFVWADAMMLPMEDNSFDVASIAYGIRNVADPLVALGEMARVVKPGGRVMVLETGDQQHPLMQQLYNFYFGKIVPVMGQWMTGKKEAYKYLNRSSSNFPAGEKFCELLRQTQAFEKVEFKSLMGGASFLYRAVKKKNYSASSSTASSSSSSNQGGASPKTSLGSRFNKD